jgi:hypothetical protein
LHGICAVGLDEHALIFGGVSCEIAGSLEEPYVWQAQKKTDQRLP